MSRQFLLIKQLSPELSKAAYLHHLPEMIRVGYRMVGVFHSSKCIGISGFWIGTKLYSGKFIEPDNVVIDKKYRSKGIGKLLLHWLEQEGRKQKCKTIMLDAYLENISGHRFYYREGFVARGFHFLKKL